jgi:hypothetical protein
MHGARGEAVFFGGLLAARVGHARLLDVAGMLPSTRA